MVEWLFPLRVLPFEDRTLVKQEQRTQDRVRSSNLRSKSKTDPIENRYMMNFQAAAGPLPRELRTRYLDKCVSRIHDFTVMNHFEFRIVRHPPFQLLE